MKKWIQKAILQKTLSYLPFSHNLNYIFQKYVTKGVYLTDTYFYDRLSHAQEHIQSYRQFSHTQIPKTCLEIGTGWYPIVPISFFLTGADIIYSVDITFLTSKKRLQTTLLKIVECNNLGLLSQYIDIQTDRYDVIMQLLQEYDTLTLNEVLQKLHIQYKIEDARALSLDDNSIDLINSNNTFEHIYPSILTPILSEFKRVLKKDTGVMSHFIDMSDHFAHFDTSINVYNFLQFSNRQWKWIDNSIQPQSRIRIYDYREIYAQLHIPILQESCREGNIEALQTLQLDTQYANKPLEEIAKSHCHFVSMVSV